MPFNDGVLPGTNIPAVYNSSGQLVPSSAEALATVNASNYGKDSIIKDWQKAASEGDVSAQEKLFNYFATQEAEKTARDWTAQREDTQYQRLISDLNKAGISPYVLTGATPASSSASYSSYSGSQMTSSESSDKSREATIRAALLRMMALGLIAVTRLI